MVDSSGQDNKDTKKPPKKDSFEQHIDDVAEEMERLGKNAGKKIEQGMKQFGKEVEQAGKHFEHKADAFGKQWDTWWDTSFSFFGPVIITLIWLGILGLCLLFFQWSQGVIPLFSTLRVFLYNNIFLLGCAFLFLSYASYFHRRHHHSIRFISPVITAIGVAFVLWFMRHMFLIFDQYYPQLFFDVIGGLLWFAFPFIILLVLVIGYIGIAFSVMFGKETHIHYPSESEKTVEKETESIQPTHVEEERSYRHLYRSGNNRFIAGICGGIGEYIVIDPVVIRVLFIIGVFVSYGTLILLYLLLWVIIPRNPRHSWK